MKRLLMMILVVGLILMGCGGSEEGHEENGENSTENGNHTEVNASNGENQTENQNNNQTSCPDPPPTCGTNVCGVVSNSCGEEVNCGPCYCDDGQVTEPTCGPCGVGIRSCEEGESGEGSCEMPPFLGIDDAGDCGQFVFVDSDRGDPSGNGSKEDPLDDIESALELAESQGAVAVLLAGGEGQSTYAGPIVARSGISVSGAFDGPNWIYSPTNRARIHTTEPDTAAEAIFGIRIENVDEPTAFTHLNVSTEDGVAANVHYGVYLYGSTDIYLTRLHVQTGDGFDGSDGHPGVAGADGGAGEGGGRAYRRVVTLPPNLRRRLAGGVNPDCPDSRGGAGGAGATLFLLSPSEPNSFQPAQQGESVGTSWGGLPGYHSASPATVHGGDGAPGAVGIDGDSGAGGSSAMQIVDGHWRPEAAGQAGQNGTQGYGGAGGGGAYLSNNEIVGAEGGGGGAGGCAGTAGTGGQGGASTIAFFALESEVFAEDSTFLAGNGGKGGDGGAGAPGGSGGDGGVGSEEACTEHNDDVGTCHTLLVSEPQGGLGGSGGAGGAGGDGGGGAGGSAIGALCSEVSISLGQPVQFSAGTPGQGGQGGSVGATGRDWENQGCY